MTMKSGTQYEGKARKELYEWTVGSVHPWKIEVKK